MKIEMICRRCATEMIVEGDQLVTQGVNCKWFGHTVEDAVSPAQWGFILDYDKNGPLLFNTEEEAQEFVLKNSDLDISVSFVNNYKGKDYWIIEPTQEVESNV